MTLRQIFWTFTTVVLLTSCDSSYELSFTYDNQSADTIKLTYDYGAPGNNKNETVTILPNERKTILTDQVIRKASSFDGCCPCKFNSISTDKSTGITSSDKWSVSKQNKNMKHKDGFVKCVFTP